MDDRRDVQCQKFCASVEMQVTFLMEVVRVQIAERGAQGPHVAPISTVRRMLTVQCSVRIVDAPAACYYVMVLARGHRRGVLLESKVFVVDGVAVLF